LTTEISFDMQKHKQEKLNDQRKEKIQLLQCRSRQRVTDGHQRVEKFRCELASYNKKLPSGKNKGTKGKELFCSKVIKKCDSVKPHISRNNIYKKEHNMTLLKRNENVNYLGILNNDEIYQSCSTTKDKQLMLQYCHEFSDYFFVEDMGGKSVVIAPVLQQRSITNNDGSETTVNDFSYSYFSQNEFTKAKIKSHFTIDKPYQKTTYPVKMWFADYWLESRTEICKSYKRTVFDPNPKFVDPSTFNFWTGFVEPISGDVTPFLNHIDNLIEGTPEQKAHIVKLIGFTVKFPHIRTDTTIILQGKQGSGKTTISETLRAMCPSHTSIVDNLDELLTGFNQEYHHTKYFLHEESIFSGDKKTNEQIKPLITGITRKSRIKNLSSVEIQNYSFHIFTSNNDNPVRIEDSDRRHNAFTCSNKLIGYKSYFKAYYDWLNNGGANALVHFFKNEVDYTHFEPTISIETDAKNLIKAQNLDPVESFIFNILAGAVDPIPEENQYKVERMDEKELLIPRRELFEHFQFFHNTAGRRIMSYNQQSFNAKLQQIFQFPDSYTEWKNKAIGRYFKFPKLAEARKLFAQHVKVSDFFSLTCPNVPVDTDSDDSSHGDLRLLVTKPSKPLATKDKKVLEELKIKPIEFTMPTKVDAPITQLPIQATIQESPCHTKVKKAYNDCDPFADDYEPDPFSWEPTTHRDEMWWTDETGESEITTQPKTRRLAFLKQSTSH
jgi:energy-coupling factor transporter ATP-binding protein EcfA2